MIYLKKIFSGFLENFIDILLDMAPYLLLGFFIAGLLHVIFPSNFIYRFFGKSKLGSSINAALLGVPLPLCSCGVIPTGLSLYKNGASKGSTLSFLISTPQTGVDSILVTYSLLGLPFAIIRPIVAFFTGIFGGYITNVLEPYTPTQDTDNEKNNTQKTLLQKVLNIFKYGFLEFMQDIAKWLAIGLILAATISAIIPDNFFNSEKVPFILQMIIMLIVSIPLYICATASVPLAAVLILKGLSPGAALVLLMAGPATNAATITLIGKVMGKKTLLIYLSTIILGSFIFGFIIDYILPAKWFYINSNIGSHNHILPYWLQISSGILLILLMIYNLAKKYFIKKTKTNNNMSANKIEVKGMSCNHCKNNVETNLKKLDFVKNVNIDLQQNKVEIEGENINYKIIEDTINGLGYEYVGKCD